MPRPATPYTRAQNITWYLTLLTILLLVLLVNGLCFIFYLSTVPGVTWQRDELTYSRVFLARLRGPAGIGYQTQTVSRTLPDGRVCVTNRVRYIMWRRDPQTQRPNTRFSHLLAHTPSGWQSTGQPCP
ncbi:MAG: hypothetical protein ACE5G8_02380 [Anaerolineae bacterium]